MSTPQEYEAAIRRLSMQLDEARKMINTLQEERARIINNMNILVDTNRKHVKYWRQKLLDYAAHHDSCEAVEEAMSGRILKGICTCGLEHLEKEITGASSKGKT